MSVGGSFGVLGIAALSWAHHLFWHIWPNTSRVVETLGRSARALGASFATYAAATLLVRSIEVLRGHAENSAWLGWDFIIPVVSLIAGYTMWWINKPRLS
jgi:hypothetical protein